MPSWGKIAPFSFNNKIYKQIDGVAMGSPLGPALENIFVGYQEEKLFIHKNQPLTLCLPYGQFDPNYILEKLLLLNR